MRRPLGHQAVEPLEIGSAATRAEMGFGFTVATAAPIMVVQSTDYASTAAPSHGLSRPLRYRLPRRVCYSIDSLIGFDFIYTLLVKTFRKFILPPINNTRYLYFKNGSQHIFRLLGNLKILWR